MLILIRRWAVFKGGTALSKCYNMIERFSEGIDLVVLRREGESDNKMSTKIRQIGKVLCAVLPEVEIEGLTHKMGMNRKTAHTYNKEFEGNYGHVRDEIVLEDFTNEIIDLYYAMIKEKESFKGMGIDFEEKAFYDILKALAIKYDFVYPEDKLLILAQKVKEVVDDKAKYTDWSKRDDIKSELKADLIVLLAESDYPPVDRDEVYKEIFEQAENYKKNI